MTHLSKYLLLLLLLLLFFIARGCSLEAFYLKTQFPPLAFNLSYERFSDCLLVPRNELRPRDCEKRSKTPAGNLVSTSC